MSVDLSNWTSESFGALNSNWLLANDGLSVLQTTNGDPTLFCSDFDVAGSTLEGQITVETNSDDDFIGFALGYQLGDNVDPDANWYLVDWKQGPQSGQIAGLSISQVSGVPCNDELWQHVDIDCPSGQIGSVAELGRGNQLGNVGWTSFTTYEFLFEISENNLRGYVDGQLELEVALSIAPSGKFCYYNYSQGNVRYSGLSRTTSNPTISPSISPSDTLPECKVLDITNQGTILARAEDNSSGIVSLSLDPFSPDVVITSNFTSGDNVANFNVAIVESPTNVDFRDVVIIAENGSGQSCSFPSIGSLLDEGCSESDDCLPDPAIVFPLASNVPHLPVLDFDSISLLVQPSFAEIIFNGTNIEYVPLWEGIQYDAFALKGETLYGDVVVLSVEYFGLNGTVDIKLDIIGQWFDYIWFDEDFVEDDLDFRMLQDDSKPPRRPTLPIEWHHEIPKGVFLDGKDAVMIPGIDRTFLNSAELGTILRRGDHRGKGAPVSAMQYNEYWKGWLDEFQTANGRLPNKDEVVNIGLERVRGLDDVMRMRDLGIKYPDHEISYSKWNRQSNRDNKIRMLQQLEDRAVSAAEILVKSKPRRAVKLALKVLNVVPIVGDVVTVGIFLKEVLVDGRPVKEALIDNGQDLIPVWGELRAVYDLLKDTDILEDLGIAVDIDSFETLVWDALLDDLGITFPNGPNSGGVAEVYPDPHFRNWNGEHFDYHGACDMIYLRNALLEIHIRTESRGSWSNIVAVAVRAGSDIVEIDQSGYYINSLSPSVLPSTIGPSLPISFSSVSRSFTIELDGGQFITSTSSSVRISAHGSDFSDSNGMSGKWDSFGFVGRDGATVLGTPTDYAMEWQVNITLGDPQLFRNPAVSLCGETPSQVDPDSDVLAMAEAACADVPKEVNREECIFDVATTGDVTFAENEVYKQPLEPLERCIASSECNLRGGSCVWRCNTESNECIYELCEIAMPMEEFGESCACAIPREFAETDMPSLSPSASPTEQVAGCSGFILFKLLCFIVTFFGLPWPF